MAEIVGVRFQEIGKIYSFEANGLTVQAGTKVVVETARGVEIGEVVIPNRIQEAAKDAPPLKPLIRIATPEDLATCAENKKKEREAFGICAKCIEKHKIDMRLVEAEYTFDGSKLIFYFTAENRVDFRELVKELAGIFHTRIELRQIGVRDEAKMLGGIGICGLPFCCASFLNDFQPVSIKMAKEQSLSLNPTKISGACGRLMCCLKYEQDAYEDATRRIPQIGSIVETPDGQGVVTEVMLLRENIRVRLNQTPEQPAQVYPAAKCQLIRKRGEAPSPQETSREGAPSAGQAATGNEPAKQEQNRPTEAGSAAAKGKERHNGPRYGTPNNNNNNRRREDHNRNGEKQDAARNAAGKPEAAEHKPAEPKSENPAGAGNRPHDGGRPRSNNRNHRRGGHGHGSAGGKRTPESQPNPNKE